MKSDQSSGQNDPFTEKLIRIVLDNLQNEQFGVSELAQITGMSRSHLHRKLSLLKNQSISQFIREIRLKESLKILEKESLTASEAAYKVGFSNPQYFNKCFTEQYGISPGEYRKGRPLQKANNARLKKRNSLTKRELVIYSFSILIATILVLVFIIPGLNTNQKEKPNQKEKSIAILPFENLSSSNENQYFADGLVDDLLGRLSKIEDFKVISRTSSEMFREKGSKSIPEIAGILGVNYILEGSIQRINDRVKIHVQLIDAKKDYHILSKHYEKNLNEVFEVQSDIAEQITKELSLLLSNQQLSIIKKNQTSNPDALKYYQMGRFHSNKRKGDDLMKSIEYYNKAIAVDSNYALAYAGLSDTYQLLTYQGKMDTTEGKNKAIEMAMKSIDLDPYLAEPHAVLGAVYIYINMDWENAEEELLKAISLNPNYSIAYQYYSELLSIYGRNEEARENINIALELDPYSFITRYLSAIYYYNNEQLSKAWEEVQMCFELSMHPWAINLQYFISMELGNDSTAFEIWKQEAIKLGYKTDKEYDSVYNIGGNEQLITCYLEDGGSWFMHEPPDHRHRSTIHITTDGYPKARYYALLKEKEKTLYYLELHHNSNRPDPFETTFLLYRFIRSEPRFKALRRKIGLPPLTE